MAEKSLKLYSFPLSGNAHRIELALSLLGLDYVVENVNLRAGEQRSDWFKKLNPAGKVPVLVDGDNVISESTAILTYLAEKYDDGTLMPKSSEARAEIQKWFTLASTELAAGPATARLITLFGASYDAEETIAKAHTFLEKLESALVGDAYLVEGRLTMADVAIYTYVAHAPEGRVSLETYPNIRAWLTRIEGLQGFVPMQKTEVSAAAE